MLDQSTSPLLAVLRTTIRFGSRALLPAALAGMMQAGAPALTGSRVLDAQQVGSEPRIGCLRGQPLPTCSSFWLVEMQAVTPLAQSRRRVERGSFPGWEVEPWEFALDWNVGHMWNINEQWALGGLVTASTESDGILGGVRGRARRWLNRDVSLEGSFGYLRMDAQSLYEGNDHGVSADLRLNIRDQGAFFVRWDHLRVKETRRGDFGSDYYDPGGPQNALLIGVGTGSVPALIGSGTLLVGLAVLFGIYIAADAS